MDSFLSGKSPSFPKYGNEKRLFTISDVAVRKPLRASCPKTGVMCQAVRALRHDSGTKRYRVGHDLEAVASRIS